jgi:Omp85 superfamily domain/Calcineurin-like phosphoesterase
MKRIVFAVCGVLFSLFSNSQQDAVATRIILIGDAGEMHNGKIAVVEKAKSVFNLNDTKTKVIFLGDNVYEYGLPDNTAKDFDEKRKILDEQVSLVRGTKASAYFIPGNHDWKKSKPGGWQQVINQQKYLESLQLPNVELLPKQGCPGPVELVVDEKLVIVFMDSQWWLEQLEKPGINSDCDCQTEEEVITTLREIASIHADKLMVVATHHPFYTHGTHGGNFGLKQHIFPLTEKWPGLYIPMPVIGSVYPIARGWFGTPQDINHPKYRTMIHDIEEALKTHPNVIHVAGHDHGLQFLQKDSISFVVSGSGSKTTRVKKGKYSLFAKKENGFAVLEIMQSGNVNITYYGVDETTALFTKSLKPIIQKSNTLTEASQISFPDSASAIGSDKFKTGGLRKLLVGKNYRYEWVATVKAPVLDIGKEAGGLKPIRRGGGHQTKSLRFEDAKGNEWVLRGIEKSVTDAALPPDLRGTFVRDIVQDGVSASYPYAAISMSVFAEAAGINHAKPRLFYVPNDPRFGKYRTDFADQLCILEEREPGGFKKTINTVDLADKLKDDNDNSVDQQEFLKARLLDMYVMDFDRHEDQWRWGVVDEKKGNRYVPIPRDRDQAFFINDGLLPWIASQPWVTPQVQGFRSKARNIRFYNFNARNLDRAYLNELNEADWKKGADQLISTMTDELIEKAMALQPEAVKKYSYSSIISKLKERRKYYSGEMMSYYKFISKIVEVVGSDKNELFDVNRQSDGTVTVTVFKITKEGEIGTKLYERKFDPAITKELRLYGQGNDDKFKIYGPGNNIKIRVIGGKGEDEFENTSAGGKTIAYDMDNGKNKFTGSFSMKLSDKPEVNEYNRLSYKYNVWIPNFSFAFNRDEGIYLGASIKNVRHNFRKTPFASSQLLSINHSVATKAYNFRYTGDFIKAVGSLDLLLVADIKAPNNVSNFFGLGNESQNNIDTKAGGINYYRTRYTLKDFTAVLAKQGKAVSFGFGAAYQQFSLDSADNLGRIITNPAESGIQLSSLANIKSYLGAQFHLKLDTRNNTISPTRGLYWNTFIKRLNGLNSNTSSTTMLSSNMSLYMSFSKNPKLVLATRVGGGISFGDFEFFQAQYLDGTKNLRGLRKFRFAGRSMLYNNTELRIKLADFRTYLFPGSLGFVFFHDVGRVWMKDDNSSKWHTGVGGGIWISPMRRTVLTISIAKSDETLPVLGLGFLF